MSVCVCIILFSTKPWGTEAGVTYTVSYAWTMAGDCQAPIAMFFALITSILVMGMDYANQTINYDLLAGYERKTVFFGRALLTILITVSGAALIMLLAPLPLAAAGGFGDSLPLWNYGIRTLVFLLLVLRITCEGIFIMVVTRKWTSAYITVALLVLMEETMDGPPKNELIPANTAGAALFQFAGWSSLHLNGEIITEYDATLPIDTLLLSAGLSILMASLFLAMAAFFFSEDDF